MKFKKSVHELVAAATAEIETWSVAKARERLDDPGVLFVDVRDVRELQRDGTIPGSFHAPRGMLEFWVDPESPYHKDIFATGRHFVFYCAMGMRSALAAQTVQDMGLAPVSHMGGGFEAWREADGPIEEWRPAKKK